MMLKGYVSREQRREKPDQHIVDYWFTSNPQSALYWETRGEAEAACYIYDRGGIMIPSAEGGKHHCTGFEVEELSKNKFAVFCLAPFIP